MKLLVTTQAVDTNEPVLGFFHAWLEELAKRVERIDVICLKEGTHHLPENVRVHTLGKPAQEMGSLGFIARCKYVLRFERLAWKLRREYDAVFVHMNSEYVVLFGAFWRLFGKRITLWYNHPARPIALSVAARLADRIFYTSPYAASASYAHARRMPAGIDTSLFRPEGAPRDRNRIYMQGRVTPGKRTHVALSALRKLREHIPDATLAIVGPEDRGYGGALKHRFADLVDSGAAAFLGPKPNAETPTLYSSAGVAVNLADAGHFDKTVLEAMACETPVVVGSDAFGGLIPGEWVVSPDDEKALAVALERLIALPEGEYRALGEKLREGVVREHALPVLMDQLVSELGRISSGAPTKEKRIKVVFGLNDFLVGGVQRQFAEQLKFYDRDKFEIVLITLFTFPSESNLYDELPKDLEVHRLHFKNTRDFRSWIELYRLLKRLKPDIVVSSLLFSNTVFRVLKPLVGYVSIAREHSTNNDRSLRQRLIGAALAPLSRRMVAISSSVADYTARYEWIPRQKFVVIYNGIDASAFQRELEALPPKEALKKELGFEASDRIVLTVGRLTKAKDQALLLQGFARFRADNPAWRLAIVGDGELRGALEAEALSLNLVASVIFFGTRLDVARFYKASDAFVLTSYREGFANACVEAMAAGIPVASTVVGGPDAYVRDGVNGFLIRERTPEAIAEALRRIARSEAGAFQEGALQTAKRFDIRSSVETYEHLFKEAVRASRGARAALKPFWNSSPIFWLRVLCFNALEAASGYAFERRRFKAHTGYELDLKHPKSLNEKMNWKKIYDRNPLLPITADKYRVRDYVRQSLGAEGESILIPLLYVTDDPRTIPFDALPEEYVIKTNHDSGGNIIIRKEDIPDRVAIITRLQRWLAKPYGIFKHEWAYQAIPRKVIIEKLIRGDDGDLAQDYKFHVFHGKVRFIHTTPKVDGTRTGKRSLFTPDWKLLPVGWKHAPGPYVDPPPQLAEMTRIAERLGAPFDYVRVDLYSAHGRVYFGELTHYHGSGMEKFDPRSFDLEAGKWWTIVPKYWETRP